MVHGLPSLRLCPEYLTIKRELWSAMSSGHEVNGNSMACCDVPYHAAFAMSVLCAREHGRSKCDQDKSTAVPRSAPPQQCHFKEVGALGAPEWELHEALRGRLGLHTMPGNH